MFLDSFFMAKRRVNSLDEFNEPQKRIRSGLPTCLEHDQDVPSLIKTFCHFDQEIVDAAVTAGQSCPRMD